MRENTSTAEAKMLFAPSENISHDFDALKASQCFWIMEMIEIWLYLKVPTKRPRHRRRRHSTCVCAVVNTQREQPVAFAA